MVESNYCYYIGVRCTAPNTSCPHWVGTFCELDIEVGEPDTNDPSQYPACLDDVADYLMWREYLTYDDWKKTEYYEEKDYEDEYEEED